MRLAKEADLPVKENQSEETLCTQEDMTISEYDPFSNACKLLLERKGKGVTVPDLYKTFGNQIDRKLIVILVDKIAERDDVVTITEHEGRQLVLRYVLKRFVDQVRLELKRNRN